MTNSVDDGDLIATLKISGHGDHEMRGPVTIGRDPRADEGSTVEVDGDPLVSKSHLCVDLDQDDLIVTDLGSSNGTFLHHSEGETAVPSDRWIPIPVGTEIEFGDQRMTIDRVMPSAPPEPAGDAHAAGNATTIEHAAQEGQPAAPLAKPAVPIAADFWAGAADEPAATPALAVPPAPATAQEHPHPGHDSNCTQCQRVLPPGSKFCDGCGAPVMLADPGRAEALAPASVVPTPFAASDDAGRTVVLPPGPQGPPPGQYGQTPPPQGAPPPGGPPSYDGPAPQPHLQQPHPQQLGGPVFVDPAAATASKGGAGKRILIGLGALVVVGLIGFGLVTVLGGGDDGSAAELSSFTPAPSEVDRQWRVDVDGDQPFADITPGAIYVNTRAPEDSIVTSLTREDGDENWSITIDNADFASVTGEFEDLVIVRACEFNEVTVCAAIGFDRADGDEVWRESVGEGFTRLTPGGLLLDADDGLTLFDPASGDRLERVRGEPIFGFGGNLLRDGEEVIVYDDDLRPLIGPVDVDPDATTVAFVDGRIVAAVGDEIEYIDENGDVEPGPILDDDITGFRLVSDRQLVAELDDEVVMYDIDGTDATERWSERGTLVLVGDPEGGQVAVVDAGDEIVVLGLDSGDVRFEANGGSDIGAFASGATNALIINDFGPDGEFGESSIVRALDWSTGDEIWGLDADGPFDIGDVIVVTDADGNVALYS